MPTLSPLEHQLFRHTLFMVIPWASVTKNGRTRVTITKKGIKATNLKRIKRIVSRMVIMVNRLKYRQGKLRKRNNVYKLQILFGRCRSHNARWLAILNADKTKRYKSK